MKKIFQAIADFFKELYYSINGEADKAFALKMQNKFERLLAADDVENVNNDIIKFSKEELGELRIVDKKFKAMLNSYKDGNKSGFVFDLGNSPKWLNENPLSDKRIETTPNIIEKAINKHNIPLPNLENLVYEVQNPVMAFPSISDNVPNGTQNVVVVTSIKNANGLPVVCAVRLDVETYAIKVDRITSIQRKDNIISFLERSIGESSKEENYINGKKFLYINNKKQLNG